MFTWSDCCSAGDLLAAQGFEVMKSQGKGKNESRVMALRLPTGLHLRVVADAAAEGVTVSHYLSNLAACRTLPSYPLLTALGQLISIAANLTAELADGGKVEPSSFSRSALAEIEALVAQISEAALKEALREL